MIVNIKFDTTLHLKNGDYIKLVDESLPEPDKTNKCYILHYMGKSRIDEDMIFNVVSHNSCFSLENYSYNGHNVVAYQFIDYYNDDNIQVKSPVIRSANETKLAEALLDIIGMDEDILYDKDSYKTILRQLKLKIIGGD